MTGPDGVRVKVIAGRLGDVAGPINGIATEPTLLDVGLPAGGRFALPLPRGHNAFAYVFEGEALLGEGDARVPMGHLAVLGEGDGVALRAGGAGARILLAGGRPLREPVARYGPFVMNTRAEIEQAISDYQRGLF